MGAASHFGATPCASGSSRCPVPSPPFPSALPLARGPLSPRPGACPGRAEPFFSPQPCLQYWPEPGLQQYGPMEVEYVSGAADEDIVSRLFRVQNVTRVRVWLRGSEGCSGGFTRLCVPSCSPGLASCSFGDVIFLLEPANRLRSQTNWITRVLRCPSTAPWVPPSHQPPDLQQTQQNSSPGVGWSGGTGGTVFVMEERPKPSILKHQERGFLSCSTINAWQTPLALHQTSDGGKRGQPMMRFAFLVAGGAPDGPAFPVPAVVAVSRHPRLQEILPAPPGPSGEVAEGERRWQDSGALPVSVCWRRAGLTWERCHQIGLYSPAWKSFKKSSLG